MQIQSSISEHIEKNLKTLPPMKIQSMQTSRHKKPTPILKKSNPILSPKIPKKN